MIKISDAKVVIKLPSGKNILRNGYFVQQKQPLVKRSSVLLCTNKESPLGSEQRFFYFFTFFLPLKRSVAHATRGRDGRQEGRESGYYNLHRNLNDALFHASPPFG